MLFINFKFQMHQTSRHIIVWPIFKLKIEMLIINFPFQMHQTSRQRLRRSSFDDVAAKSDSSFRIRRFGFQRFVGIHFFKFNFIFWLKVFFTWSINVITFAYNPHLFRCSRKKFGKISRIDNVSNRKLLICKPF